MQWTNLAPRNIVLLFDESLTEKFINLSNQINQMVPSKVVLNRNDMLPHLTIYGTRFPQKNLKRLQQWLKGLIKDVVPFSLHFHSKNVTAGTVFIDAELTRELYQLHEKLVDGLNPLREGAYDEKELELPGLTDGMKRSLLTYGMLLAKEEYRPHVTVARPFDSQRCEEALSILPEKIDLRTEVNAVSLVETGPSGTCKRVLRTFPFG